MRFSLKSVVLLLAVLVIGVFVVCDQAVAQGSSGTIQGVVNRWAAKELRLDKKAQHKGRYDSLHSWRS